MLYVKLYTFLTILSPILIIWSGIASIIHMWLVPMIGIPDNLTLLLILSSYIIGCSIDLFINKYWTMNDTIYSIRIKNNIILRQR